MEGMALSGIETGRSCRVLGITDGMLRARMEHMGVTPGVVVTRLFDAPCGDPAAYEVRGAALALRKKDADGILVLSVGSGV